MFSKLKRWMANERQEKLLKVRGAEKDSGNFCSFHPHTDAGAPQSMGLSQTCGCQVGWQGGGKPWEFGVSRGKLLYRDGETPQVLLK